MKSLLMLSFLAFLLIAGNVSASTRIVKKQETTESVVPELSEIVVLCATEQEKKFEKEWSKYVSHHKLKGRKLNEAIRDVSDQAEAYRHRETISESSVADTSDWKAKRRQLMKEVAERAIITAR